jgi:hypothetical protein
MIHIVVVRDLGRMLLMMLGHRYVCICIGCCETCFLLRCISVLPLNGANVDAFLENNDQYDMQLESYLV